MPAERRAARAGSGVGLGRFELKWNRSSEPRFHEARTIHFLPRKNERGEEGRGERRGEANELLLDTKVQKSREEEGGREGSDGRTRTALSERASERPRREFVS